jgi:hypothetical protein
MSSCPGLNALVHDMKRFTLHSRSVIEQAPLQAYCSALVFAPSGSMVKKQFEGRIPAWMKRLPRVESEWSAVMQTLEGHSDYVTAVAFSPNGKVLASASYDFTVKLWEAGTGTALHTHRVEAVVSTLSFSSDGVFLLTDHGVIDTGFLPTTRSLQHSTSPEIFVHDRWIALQGSRMLWLPPEYRGASTAVCGDVVALGQRSGRVSLLAIAL